MKWLVINADDFGLTDGVTRGICESMLRGNVTTTSVMACVPGSLERAARHANELRGRIGVHLQLTDGIPCAGDVPSLTSDDGCFPRIWWQLKNPVPHEIRREWQCQLDRVFSAGITPSHIDTHHDVHRIPAVFDVYRELAGACGLPARTLTRAHTIELRRNGVRCADHYETWWHAHDLTPEGMLRCLERAFDSGCESVELMTHPGYCDEDLLRKSSYTNVREQELSTLCDSSVRELLEQAGIQLSSRRGDGECER